jgi:hypothetical protein
MDLDQIGPRLDLEMTADAKPPMTSRTAIETRPRASTGDTPVGADQPPSVDRAVIGFEAAGGNSADSDTPAQIHAKGFGASPECPVQLRTADTKAWSTGKNPLGRQFIVEVTDAAERARAHHLEIHSQRFQDRHAVGHQTLSTGPVQRRPAAVQYDHLKATEAGRNGGGQPCRAPTHNDDVGVISQDSSGARPGPSPATIARPRRPAGTGSP